MCFVITTPTDMTTIAAREAKRQFGRLLDTSQREPVTIEKHGRPVAVVVSKHDYDRIQEQLAEAHAWRETEYLLSSEANRKALEESAAQSARGETVEKTMEELLSHED